MPDKLASKARSAHRVQILPHTSELTLASHGPKAYFYQEDVMDLTLCGQSAFYYHRIPPQVLGLYPVISLGNMDRRCCGLGSHAVVKDLLHAPLHRLVFTRAQSGSRSLFKSHLLTQEPPPGSFRQTEHGFDVTSPEFTLLSLATQVSRNQLLMACYEMCGSFAVFKPCERTQQQLDEAISLKFIPPNCGWKRVVDTKGNGTILWKRTPLLTQRISPRSPSKPQACAASNNSVGPQNA